MWQRFAQKRYQIKGPDFKSQWAFDICSELIVFTRGSRYAIYRGLSWYQVHGNMSLESCIGNLCDKYVFKNNNYAICAVFNVCLYIFEGFFFVILII